MYHHRKDPASSRFEYKHLSVVTKQPSREEFLKAVPKQHLSKMSLSPDKQSGSLIPRFDQSINGNGNLFESSRFSGSASNN